VSQRLFILAPLKRLVPCFLKPRWTSPPAKISSIIQPKRTDITCAIVSKSCYHVSVEILYMCLYVYYVYVVRFLHAWVSVDLFPLSRNVQKYNCTVWNKSVGVTKTRGDPEEKIEGINACIHELEYYWVISLEDDVHENYSTLLSPLR